MEEGFDAGIICINIIMRSRIITELTNVEAKEFFMDEKNYINFDLPYYFNFTSLLLKVDRLVNGRQLCDLCKKDSNGKAIYPKKYEKVNYTFLSNKDGAFAWRPLQIIHPILYVDLINLITDEASWNSILGRFKQFSKSTVKCISIPRKSLGDHSHKSSQVSNWWEEIEQQSIKMALHFDYIFTTDIANCYGSIYTHSIDWSLDPNGKAGAKSSFDNNEPKTLGALVDIKVRNMNFGQTNGIPQGSTLMDFIAEMVLGYADLELSNALMVEKINEEEYSILRYRDDYRIFVNNPVVGNQILKQLNRVLYELGLKMNPSKTTESNDIILSSIKPEKLERFFIAPKEQSYQKEALRIYQLSKKHPNSGLISKELSVYFDKIEKLKFLENTDIEVLISTFSMIAYNSPSAISWTSGILSLLLEMIKDKNRRKEIIKTIHVKFKAVPNSSPIDVWLQRISAPLGNKEIYQDALTKSALQEIKNTDLWESRWLIPEIAENIDSINVSSLKSEIENKTISPTMERYEVELFKISYND